MWWYKRYPGFGPWSYLPPWERPGWRFGRGRGRGWGWCWWLLLPEYSAYEPQIPKEEELKILEEEARFLEEELDRIRKRIDELKGEKA